MIISGSPNSTGWPSSTRIWITVPERGAGIWFIVFIASMMSSVSPALTREPMSTNGRAPGSAPTIGGADHRRGDEAGMLRRIDAADGSRGRRRDGHIDRRATAQPRCAVARDAHADAVLLDRDLGEAGLVEQLRQLADQVVIDRWLFRWLVRLARHGHSPIIAASPVMASA